jgi:hypothetical protein
MLDSAGTRRVMSGSRTINGKRYALETEVVALATDPDGVGTHRQAVPAVLDKLQEMLHKSLTAFARHGAEPVLSTAPGQGVEDRPSDRDYDSLIDCVIADQRGTDLPAYLLDLAENLERTVGQTAKASGQLVFVVTGQMVEADLDSAGTPVG